MKTNPFFRLVIACAILISAAVGCSKTTDAVTVVPTYNGTEQVLGNGKAFTWAKFTADGKPTSLGVTLTKGTLENLSHTGATEMVLTLAPAWWEKRPSITFF